MKFLKEILKKLTKPIDPLFQMAMDEIKDYEENDDFNHGTSEGLNFSQKIKKYSWSKKKKVIRENLYKGPKGDIRHIVKMWNDSPKHKANLDKDFDRVIIIIKKTKKGDYYAVFEAEQINF